ncbi:Thiol peroxidase [Chryseobacterium oranimense G311]|uniref:thiol peroxidase n=1 Tax=Chryseobacterium oranimense TaxID=421058 RepID=UPI000533803D|nr:thiol peroxidase [Chryseobacterium oranimense]CEJ68858.1 Thiol peroxidase [Chryseobacterium oranimense G311]
MVSRLIFSAAILFSVFGFAQNTVLMGGKPVHTYSKLPAVNKAAPRFTLTDVTMKDQTLDSYKGKYVILNIFPSVDTGVCSASVHHFNEDAGNIPNTVVLCISKDLPFAQKRFCGAEGIKNVVMLSDFRSDFGKTYGVEVTDSVMKGLLSRAVVVIDPSGKIIYEEQVADISHEPNYEAAIAAVKK